ncbi:hypothetical protein [Rickettsia endosymbiont of Ceutorhynchus obstrictus]
MLVFLISFSHKMPHRHCEEALLRGYPKRHCERLKGARQSRKQ